jgi:hypothetical protein
MENHGVPLDGACKNYEEDLVLYYYGESCDAERAAMQQHMAECGPCRNFVDDLGRVLPQMAPQPELPQSFWDSYFLETKAKLDAHEARQSWWRGWFAPLNGWLVPAFGTMAVAALAIALVLEKSDLVSFVYTPAPSIPVEVLVDSNQLEFFKSLEILESLGTLEELDAGKPQPKISEIHNGRTAPAIA